MIRHPRSPWFRIFCLVALASSLARASAAPLDDGEPVRAVVLVRHAEIEEGGGGDPALSESGRARAAALADALAGSRVTRVVTSSLVRTRQTGAPVAERFELSPIAVSTSGGLDAHVREVVEAVREPAGAGVVLVVGHSNTVPRILHALGGPELADLEHGEYGLMFVLLTDADGATSLIRSHYAAAPAPEQSATTADSTAPPARFDVNDPLPHVEYPPQADSAYVLPYPVGERHNVRQGNGNPTNTHNETYGATFAYDFEMPIGSQIVAARGGRVLALVEQFTDEQHDISQGNYIAIDHGDQSYAIYGHITHEGALVEVGEQVGTGQPLALSGNSGLSRGPHLHFAVKQCPEGERIGSSSCATIPISFRNTRPHPRGLIGSATSELGGGEWYEALPD